MKKRKGALGLAVLLVCLCTSLSAQQKIAGIYQTWNDFLADHLTYTTDNSHTANRIFLHEFSGKDYVTLHYKGRHIKLQKNAFFAYKTTSGNIYRAAPSYSCQVMNYSSTLLLYKRKIPGAPKTFPEGQYRYYFSTAHDNTLQPLTTWNLKKAFPDNFALHNQLDALFTGDDTLTQYDAFHKMYKLEWLLAGK